MLRCLVQCPDEKEPIDQDEGRPVMGGGRPGVSRVGEGGRDRGSDTDCGKTPVVYPAAERASV